MPLPTKPRALLETLFIAIFLAGLALPGIGFVVAPNPGFVLDSGQLPAPRPTPPKDLASLFAWPMAMKAYFAENFGGRERLIRWNSALQLGWLGMSMSDQVLAGREGWLYFTADKSLEDHRGVFPLTDGDRDALAAALRQLRLFHEQRGIPLILVACPNKDTLYPEYLPARLGGAGRATRMDRFMREFGALEGLQILDLRAPLRAAKAADRVLYPKHESHWNDRGAFLAYREIIKALVPRFPALRIPVEADFTISLATTQGGDLARLIGQPAMHDELVTYLPKGGFRHRTLGAGHIPRAQSSVMVEYLTTEREGAPIPRAVMFRDSFGAALMPFLSEDIGHVEYRWRETRHFDHALVDRECPDVVIIEFVERALRTWWLPDPLPLSAIPLPGPSSCFCAKPGGQRLPGCRRDGADPGTGGLVIKRARWGDPVTGTFQDLTSLVSAQVGRNDRVDFPVDIQTLGDPTPGHGKQLVVEYEIDGVPGNATVNEGGRMRLGKDPMFHGR